MSVIWKVLKKLVTALLVLNSPLGIAVSDWQTLKVVAKVSTKVLLIKRSVGMEPLTNVFVKVP